MKLLFVAVLFVQLITYSVEQKILYFHHNDPDHPKQMNLAGIRNNPIYIPLDCSKKNCDLFVKTTYPSLYYWKGPGSAFEKIHPPTQQAARAHMFAKQIGLFNRFRRFLEQANLFQTFVYATLFAYFLYTVFTYLFSPPHIKKPSHKNHKKKQ